MELGRADGIAYQVVEQLKPFCRRVGDKVYIEVVGSIRRRKSIVNDIDLVLIPTDRTKVDDVLLQLGGGRMKMNGKKIARLVMSAWGNAQLDIYYATPETWATLLLIRTGSVQNNIRLAAAAKGRGWRLAASGDGLFNEYQERIAGDTEESIYHALGLTYQEPWERN